MMIGIVIVTHYNLAVELKQVVEHVLGPQEQIVPLPMMPGDDPVAFKKDILRAIEQVDAGQGVVILTDMFGGTPSNLAVAFSAREDVEAIAGVNVPMLVQLTKLRAERSLPEVVESARLAAIKYIKVASQYQ